MKDSSRRENAGQRGAWLVILAGVVAALHVGKLPPALPVLREALGLSLLQAGFLLSMVQFAGMTLGLVVGLFADGLGLRRSMLWGMALLTLASALGGMVRDPWLLMGLRAVEGLGFLAVSLPGPALIRQLVRPQRMSAMLGMWGTYMPTGTALALLVGPVWMSALGWPSWWFLFAVVSGAMGLWLAFEVPSDRVRLAQVQPFAPAPMKQADDPLHWWLRLKGTLSAAGPWLVALTFAMYSLQWIAVIGFLPSIYAQAGLSGAVIGALSALAAAANIIGNVTAGFLLQRAVPPPRLLAAGFLAMGLGSWLAFGPSTQAHPAMQFIGVFFFSATGGLVPGTLFSLAVRLAPHQTQVSSTVGWMQQCSAFGQFAGPPLVAALAAYTGGWQWTWMATGTCCLAGLWLTARISGLLTPR